MSDNAFAKKETINAIIRTASEKVDENIFKFRNSRLLGTSNKRNESFIPLIVANVFCLVTGNVLFQSEFFAANKQHIFLIADHLATE